MLSRFTMLCAGSLMLIACSEGVDRNTSNSVETSFIAEAKQAAIDEYGSNMAFLEIYENKNAVCGIAKNGEGDPQQFIYVRNKFLLEEMSMGGEWESLWFSECDDG